ncbi:MAG TPA: acetyl-CoA C-acyltransferase, partial [bacterium]|nr:acetyl-CoA C-acyltransferase [bacterium]
GNAQVVDSLIHDGLWDIYHNFHMGLCAEKLAEKYQISRDQQDAYALTSQRRCHLAVQQGKFQQEIVPLTIPQHKGESIIFNQDEFPRPSTTLEALSRLKPAFKENGTVTAGNASGINDGAAAVLVTSEEETARSGLKPMAEIVGWASAGIEPAMMGLGPVLAIRKVLERTGLRLDEIDLIELNEAFAAQVLAVNREMGWDTEKINVNGGAIALGHPIGASGARILVTLLYEMQRRKVNYGLATLCVGGGQGMAMIIRRRE